MILEKMAAFLVCGEDGCGYVSHHCLICEWKMVTKWGITVEVVIFILKNESIKIKSSFDKFPDIKEQNLKMEAWHIYKMGFDI